MLRKIIKGLFSFLNKVLYRVEYVNFDKFPLEGPAIIASNHQHTFDVSVIHCKSKTWLHWVAKKELIDAPIVGKLIEKMGVIPVDRKKNDMSVIKAMLEKIKNKQMIAIFPQGTRITKKKPMNIVIPKTGAVHIATRTNTPIIPVGVLSDFKLFGKVKVVVGDAIDFSKMTKTPYPDDDLMNKTIFMMETIYDLIGVDYQLDVRKTHDE